MATLGDVTLDHVEEDKPERVVKVSERPSESGSPITDHVKMQPYALSIEGIITGPDAAVRLAKLEDYMQKGQLIEYSNRVSLYGCIIERFNSGHGVEVKGGFTFSIRLRRIKTAAATPYELISSSAILAAVKKTGNAGLQQTLTPAQMAAANNNRLKGR